MAKHTQRKGTVGGQTQRYSHRHRFLNIRLGTPPKILQDMMKNRATNRLGKHHFAAEGVENMESVPQKAASVKTPKKLEKRNVKPSETVETLELRPRRQHIPSKRYGSPFEEVHEVKNPSRNVPHEEATEETPIATETAPHQSFSVLKKRRSEHLDNAPTLIRQSTRHRIPNRLFDFIVPGFLSIEKGKEGGNKKESDKGKKRDAPVPILKENEVDTHGTKTTVVETSQKTPNEPAERRFSLRQRTPNKRLSFPNVAPANIAIKKARNARQGQTNLHMNSVKIGDSKDPKKDSQDCGKIGGAVDPQKLSVAAAVMPSSSRQIHNSSEIPSLLYPYKPARSTPLCVHSSSPSVVKDYTSKKDVDDLLEEIECALICTSEGRDFSELRQKVAHHLTNLYKENCRSRQTIRRLRAEISNLSANGAIDRFNMLMKQNGELREQKVLADIRYEARTEEVIKMRKRIKYLEMRNKDLEENGDLQVGEKQPETQRADSAVHEEESLNGLELPAAFEGVRKNVVPMNGDRVENGLQNGDVNWGNDAWMLHCQ